MSKNDQFNFTVLVFIFFAFINSINCQNLESRIDNLLENRPLSSSPGGILMVAENGIPISTKTYGNSMLNPDIPMKIETSFSIGDLSRLFTTTAILMLLEEGKLNVNDNIRKFIPDYPSKIITVESLLRHTSGIKDYRSISHFKFKSRAILPSELIDLFKNKPLNFETGTDYKESSSEYILLGYIIEKVTKKPYYEFIENSIFKKLKMNSSYFRGIFNENLSKGYMKASKFIPMQYNAPSYDYAYAGLVSNVFDMLKWRNAIEEEILFKLSTLEKVYKNFKNRNIEMIDLMFGGRKIDINGVDAALYAGVSGGHYSTLIYVPKKKIFAIFFTNCNCYNPYNEMIKIIAWVIGKPYPETIDSIKLSKEEKKKWLGKYRFDNGIIRYIFLKDDQLYSQRENKKRFKIYPLTSDKYFFEDGTFYKFKTINGGKRAVISFGKVSQEGVFIDESLPTETNEFKVDLGILETYNGTYEIDSKTAIEIVTNDENGISAILNGLVKYDLQAVNFQEFQSEKKDLKIIFNTMNGAVNGALITMDKKVAFDAKKVK